MPRTSYLLLSTLLYACATPQSIAPSAAPASFSGTLPEGAAPATPWNRTVRAQAAELEAPAREAARRLYAHLGLLVLVVPALPGGAILPGETAMTFEAVLSLDADGNYWRDENGQQVLVTGQTTMGLIGTVRVVSLIQVNPTYKNEPDTLAEILEHEFLHALMWKDTLEPDALLQAPHQAEEDRLMSAWWWDFNGRPIDNAAAMFVCAHADCGAIILEEE